LILKCAASLMSDKMVKKATDGSKLRSKTQSKGDFIYDSTRNDICTLKYYTFEVLTPRGVTRYYDYSLLVCDTLFGRNIISQMIIILTLTT